MMLQKRGTNMKKLFIVLALAVLFTSTAAAKRNTNKFEAGESSISYVNVPILKVLEGREGYVIVYQKNQIGVGNVVIPKKWLQSSKEEPGKLKIRTAKTSNSSYMCIVKKDGEFQKVILNVPTNKSNAIWGVIDYRKGIEGTDKDTLEEIEF